MMAGKIEWVQGIVFANRIEEFLKELNEDFVPSLSSRVDIKEYSLKLAEFADTIFLYNDNNELMASCSIYCNCASEYISSIAVKKKYRGIGVGALMMGEVKHHVKTNCDEIGLRVHKDNIKAIAYYRGSGFIEKYNDGVWIEMVCQM